MNPSNAGLGLRLTPSNSPYHRSPVVKPAGKANGVSADPCLTLKRISGTTTSLPSAFDCLPLRRCFAYTAGAAAVVVELDAEFRPLQRFFRARPTAMPLNSPTSSTYPSTPTRNPAEARNKAHSAFRDATYSPVRNGSPMGDWGDSPSSKTWTARERIKAATCVSLSPDGRYLAVGETGYSPRVLIFSTARDASPDVPLTIVGEHSYGVTAVAFSPDSRYLATLGSTQDGFIHVFAINPRNASARLVYSNKCTSYITSMVWMGKSTLVTAGTRHVKVWRVDDFRPVSPSKQRFVTESTTGGAHGSPMSKSLPGRNCLLGSLVDATFTCAARLSDDKVIVCTRQGHICMVRNSDSTQKLSVMTQLNLGIKSCAIDSEGRHLWVGDATGNTRQEPFAMGDLISPQTPPESPPPQSVSSLTSTARKPAGVVALATMADALIAIDSDHFIRVSRVVTGDHIPVAGPVLLEYACHTGPVLGVEAIPQPNSLGAWYYTWSADGTVFFWDLDGKIKAELSVDLADSAVADDDTTNELRVVRASPEVDFFVSGDRLGFIGVISGVDRRRVWTAKAHGAEIMDIAVQESKERTLIASCARDRTVQLFQRGGDSWSLIQTLDEHAGSVGALLFLDDGQRLLSSSGDRTIVVRELASRAQGSGMTTIAYLPIRTLTMKSTPVSMAWSAEDTDTIVVSTIDRFIHKLSLSTGKETLSFRLSDDSNDAVVMDALILGKETMETTASAIIFGVATTDKSIRVYDHSGSLISKEWGHTEGISDIALLQASSEQLEHPVLVSTGIDGTLYQWSYCRIPPQSADPDTPVAAGSRSPPKDAVALRTPLRKVLSRAELASFQRPSEQQAADSDSTPSKTTSPPRTLRKKTSRYNMTASRASLAPVPSVKTMFNSSSPNRDRSPSPSPPKSARGERPEAEESRRPSLNASSRTRSLGNVSEFGSLNMSCEQLSRTLRAFRKKLANSTDGLRADNVRELERELGLTMKAVGDNTKAPQKSNTASDAALAKLLEQYSEKLVEKVGEKVAWEVAQSSERRRASASGSSSEASIVVAVGEG